jgi:hypothetical protein
LLDFFTALFARSPRVVIPEIEHRLAEMLDDVSAVEVNVFHQRAAIFAVKNDMLLFSGRTAALDHHANSVWRPLRRVRDVWRDEKRLAFAHDVIDDAVAFTDSHFDVALQLVEIFFRIDEMKIVSRVWPFDNHHEKIATVVEIAVAHGRLEQMAIFFDPIIQINWRLHGRRTAALGRLWLVVSGCSDEASLFASARSVKPVECMICHGTAKTTLRSDIYS